MNLLKHQKVVGLITIVSGIIAIACMFATLVAINFNTDCFSNPLLILSTQGTSATAARWSMIADMFGYYLMLLPVIYLLHDWMKNKTAWSNLKISTCYLLSYGR